MSRDPVCLERTARHFEERLTRAMKECLAADGALLPLHVARHIVGQYQELGDAREDVLTRELFDELGAIAGREGRRTIDVLREAVRKYVEERR